jgi:hypothetical protein
VEAFTLPAEDAQDLHRSITCGAEPMRDSTAPRFSGFSRIRVTDMGRTHQRIERDAVRLGDRYEQLEAGLALPGLQLDNVRFEIPVAAASSLRATSRWFRTSGGPTAASTSSKHVASSTHDDTITDSRVQQRTWSRSRHRRSVASEVIDMNAGNYDVVIVGGVSEPLD